MSKLWLRVRAIWSTLEWRKVMLAAWLVAVLVALWGIHRRLSDVSSIESELSSIQSDVSSIESDLSYIKNWGVQIDR